MNNNQKNIKSGAIGVLDLQGGVFEHLIHLERLGVAGRRVKYPPDLANLAGLIIPGGESTCISRLLNIFEIKEPLLAAYRAGMKIWGTCAGAILVAGEVTGEQACLSIIDIAIERNSFGSQLDSFQKEALIPEIAAEPLPLTFIRAPKILRAGPDVNILLKVDDYIAAAESDKVLATVFHPELTGCIALHRYFAKKCGLTTETDKKTAIDPLWKNESWTKLARIAK
ncbi:MAG TPA: pyridoxal 5'-phosphate synthase glutaminase subunit PdxT [Smithellaceae bacterium]|nr:pyridoxal 5'-phosphate synthase glutaminase subunit PdxT [Smithellaceae bacterium]